MLVSNPFFCALDEQQIFYNCTKFRVLKKMSSLLVAGLIVAAAATLWMVLLLFVRRDWKCFSFQRKEACVPPGSVVLITGAGSGIGRELAMQMLLHSVVAGSSSDSHIVLVGRTDTSLEDTKGMLLQSGRPNLPSISTFPCDITSSDDALKLRSYLVKLLLRMQAKPLSRDAPVGTSLPRLSHLILNAGSGAIMPFRNSEWGAFERVSRELMELNYFANVRLLHILMPLMVGRAAGQGLIVDPARVLVITSLAGVLPSTLRSSYTASKHAMQGFIDALRGEYHKGDITFTCACPGYVDTAFHAKASAVGERDKSPATGHHRAGAMSAATCAALCVKAYLAGEPELILTTSGRLAYLLRPWIPQIVDHLAAKKSLASVGKQLPSRLSKEEASQ